jgi:hypothetical protein
MMLLLDRLQRKTRNSSREGRTAHRARKRVEEDRGDGVDVEEADDATMTVAALGDDEDGEDVLGQLPLRTFSEEDEGTTTVPSPRSDATRHRTTRTKTSISGGFS